jgi:subtilisin family serine protease
MTNGSSPLFRAWALTCCIGLLALAGCDAAQVPGPDPVASSLSPSADARTSDAIPDQYVVVFQGSVADAPGLARQLARQHGGEAFFVYEHALKGFAFRGSAQAAAALARNPNVAYVEQDQVMRAVGTQSNATWGLDRTDQRALPLNGTYTYATSASNVHAYIIDTGIRFSHQDFGGRVQSACYDAFGGNCNDGNGHGTHVAGTVGGTVYGIAKGVKLYAVRVLDNQGSGTTTGVIAGVDWVTAHHVKPAVANMSLGGGASTALDDAVRRSIGAGVSYAVAAGNGDFIGRQQPACNYSPARVREAMTVGATTNTDSKTSWSNYGECVDIFAPGASITSAWHTGDAATNTISGTSMASPHVAGVMALYLAGNTGASPAQVFQAVYDNTTKNIVTNSSTANNHLLYSLFDGSGGGSDPQPPPPSGDITLSATGFKSGGRNTIDLAWTGSSATSIDVFRNGSKIATVSNSGEYRDNTGQRGGGTYRHKVCNAGTTTCSNETTTTF